MPADPYGKLVLYPSEHDGTGFVACLQNGAPVAFVSRHLSKSELKFGVLTRLVALVAWAVRRLRRYTTFASDIQVVVPTGVDAVVVAAPTAHMRLRTQVVDLQQYAVRWVEGDNPWSAT